MEKSYATMVQAVNYDEGNHQLFEKIVATYQTKLLRYIQRLVGDTELSADILQDTFLGVYAYLSGQKKFELPESQAEVLKGLQPLIYTIARNKSLDELRRRNRLQFVPIKSFTTGYEKTGQRDKINPALEYKLSGPGSNLESQYILSNELKEAIEQVGSGKMVNFFLHMDGYSYKEIGQLTGDSMSTVKSKIFRCKQSLRQVLQNNLH